MIGTLSSWAKNLGVTIVIVSILEMLLPNNKIKKYIRMILGIYILFNIISPFIQNKDEFNLENLEIEKYKNIQTINIDQTSMDKRIKELYESELEKDIIQKIEEKGFEVTKCEVETQIANKDEETKINSIRVIVQKNEKNKIEEIEKEENKIENKIVTEIQKIKKVEITSKENNEKNTENKNSGLNKNNLENTDDKITISDIQNIKKFLIDEYGVKEKCLKIN